MLARARDFRPTASYLAVYLVMSTFWLPVPVIWPNFGAEQSVRHCDNVLRDEELNDPKINNQKKSTQVARHPGNNVNERQTLDTARSPRHLPPTQNKRPRSDPPKQAKNQNHNRPRRRANPNKMPPPQHPRSETPNHLQYRTPKRNPRKANPTTLLKTTAMTNTSKPRSLRPRLLPAASFQPTQKPTRKCPHTHTTANRMHKPSLPSSAYSTQSPLHCLSQPSRTHSHAEPRSSAYAPYFSNPPTPPGGNTGSTS